MSALLYNKARATLGGLNRRELEALLAEISALLPYATEPTREEQILKPGEYLTEKHLGKGCVYLHWYERGEDGTLNHKVKFCFRGTKADYLESLRVNQ